MSKVYLVYAQGCDSTGKLNLNSKYQVITVFTNKKLAIECADYHNKEWTIGFQRNADFKEENIKFFYVVTFQINRNDYSKLPF